MKLTAGAPLLNQLAVQEGCLNVVDKALYYKANADTLVVFKDENWINQTISDALSNAGGGNMLKSVYDIDDDGKVDIANNAEQLGGIAANDYATKNHVADQITALVNSSPAALDTLSELAAALGDDANFAATVTAALASKLDANSTIDGGTIS